MPNTANASDSAPLQSLAPKPVLDLPVGSPLSLEVENAQTKFHSTLVGFVSGQYVLAATPATGHFFSVRPREFIGGKIIVRYVAEGRVAGFETKLLGALSEPAKLLFLSFPKAIDNINLREQGRHPCSFPTSIAVKEIERPYHAVITDINEIGCRVFLKESDEAPLALLPTAVGDEMMLKFYLPGIAAPQEVSGEVRRSHHTEGHCSIGIKFRKLTPELKKSILDYEAMV